MEYTKVNCLDLQFILPKIANKANNIQKTIIFINYVSEICLLINIIISWIKKLGYLDFSTTRIRQYHSMMTDWDKDLIANAFLVPGDKNMECVILEATNTYDIFINNLDIKFVM